MNNDCTTALYRSSVILIVSIAITGITLAMARAADSSDWSNDSRSAMRLIAATNKPNEPLMAGIEIKLEPGWHTYWRYPGDAGVPPQFDFSGSVNLKTAQVLYPVPQLHEDETGHSIVYENSVIFPVKITPEEAGQPVRLKVTLAYAVCEKVCIPANGQAELELGIGESSHEQAVQAARTRVPKSASASDIGLSLRRVSGLKPSVSVDLQAVQAGPIQLFVEGPTPEWALPIPKQAPATSAGPRQFTFELDGLPAGADPNAPVGLTFTIVQGNGGFEVKTHLD